MRRLNEPVYIVEALRTPIGRSRGGFADLSAARLAARVIREILHRHKINKRFISHVVLGNTVLAGTGQNLSRQAALLAGLPVSIPAWTISNVCGSGLQSIIQAVQSIRCGDSDIVLAGGTESASQCPMLKFPSVKGDNTEESSLIYDGLWCSMTNKHMGELAELMAKKFGISRAQQDEYALQSYQKALQSQQQGRYSKEIVPVIFKKRRINKDEHLPGSMTMDKLRLFPPAFQKRGTITAGNSSIPSNGAAVVLLSSARGLKKYQLIPRAAIRAYTSIMIDPALTFTAGVKAVNDCLKRASVSFNSIDLFEISEAFAVQAIYTQRVLKILPHKMNVWGGDVALGHPFGAAGARIMVTLLHALENQKKKRGLACVCFGGGGAVAIVIDSM